MKDQDPSKQDANAEDFGPLFSEEHEATYCPEDNKLRLYVGRVPRDQFLALRAEGWTSTPKQDCDFAATWKPDRADTALAYAGTIGDEDTDPAERAADRAERFAGYRDKRTSEALGHADSYDEGPAIHGRQNMAKAARAADRHDRQATRALTAWDKADYWTSRTAGVISNALYLSRPDVRMGRIKKLETQARRLKDRDDEWGQRWRIHTENRLAYEEAMLEAVGGRAAVVEMEKGGTYGGFVITRVNKSNASGNVVSLRVLDAQGKEIHWDIERETGGRYEPPTDESKLALAEFTKAKAKATRAANASKPKLLNPTKEEAEKLQKIRNGDGEAVEIVEVTQARYSELSKTHYGVETKEIKEGGTVERSGGYMRQWDGREVLCKVRFVGRRVVVLTNKPQKPLPAGVFIDPEPIAREWCKTNPQACFDAVQKKRAGDSVNDLEGEAAEAWRMMRRAHWVRGECWREANVSEALSEIFREAGVYAQKTEA